MATIDTARAEELYALAAESGMTREQADAMTYERTRRPSVADCSNKAAATMDEVFFAKAWPFRVAARKAAEAAKPAPAQHVRSWRVNGDLGPGTRYSTGATVYDSGEEIWDC